jgi:hypothetical protein
VNRLKLGPIHKIRGDSYSGRIVSSVTQASQAEGGRIGPWGRTGCSLVPLYAAPCKVESVTPRHFLPFRDTSNLRVGGCVAFAAEGCSRIPPGAPIFTGSIPDTWFTDYSGDMVNTFSGTKGFGAGSTCEITDPAGHPVIVMRQGEPEDRSDRGSADLEHFALVGVEVVVVAEGISRDGLPARERQSSAARQQSGDERAQGLGVVGRVP